MIETGYKEFNISNSELIVIASRPAIGKSTFAINIINNVSKVVKGNILYFNLETIKERLKGKITSDKVEIIYNEKLSIKDIINKSKSNNNLSLIVIDYLQIIESNNLDIIKELKLLAIELNIPIILLSQLSRSVEDKEDSKPTIDDFSKGKDKNIDKLIMLYRNKEDNLEIIFER